MARVTVEDCVKKVPNRFELVLTAAQRARGILSGDPLTIDRDHDKNPVVALREIAGDHISVDDVKNELVSSLQRIKRREEEQAAIDEAASLAQDDMAAFNSVFGPDMGTQDGMQIGMMPQFGGGRLGGRMDHSMGGGSMGGGMGSSMDRGMGGGPGGMGGDRMGGGPSGGMGGGPGGGIGGGPGGGIGGGPSGGMGHTDAKHGSYADEGSFAEEGSLAEEGDAADGDDSLG